MPLVAAAPITGIPVTGQPIDRRDGRLKVLGRARYAAEFDIDNLVHAVLVQSTIASGEIAGFDLADAQAAPGVLTILTPDNAPRLAQRESDGPMIAKPLLQDKLVYYSGQHIAVVVADTLERAQHAAPDSAPHASDAACQREERKQRGAHAGSKESELIGVYAQFRSRLIAAKVSQFADLFDLIRAVPAAPDE